jgi:hypothetical protein
VLIRIAAIVEGEGEREAVPILVRRIAAEVDPSLQVEVKQPLRISRQKLVKRPELERAVELAARLVKGMGGILIVLDADDDCPKELGPQLLAWAKSARADLRIYVVLAKREFEAWFLAAARSLRGKRGLNDQVEAHPTPEGVRGAKEWLTSQMRTPGKRYSEVLDQPALTAVFDVEAARTASPSFAKFYRDARDMVSFLRAEASSVESLR